MKWASAISEGPNLSLSLEQCAQKLQAELGHEAPPSLVVVFASIEYGVELEQVPSLVRSFFPHVLLFGCCASGVIGSGIEIENRPAVAVTAGHLPGVGISPFRITQDTLPSPDDPPQAWMEIVQVRPEDRPSFLLLIDPFSGPADELLAGLDFAFPGAAKIGGLASGGRRPGSHVLYLGDRAYRDGGVGVALSGNIAVDTVVAQGCRPIGETKTITRCQDNLLLELDGQQSLAYLYELYEKLPSRDQALLNSGNLFLGISTSVSLLQGDGGPSEFLVRNLLGADQEHGILAVGERLREGQVVQFHVRDRRTSAEDLQKHLLRYTETKGKGSPAGALIFQCTGRGAHLYGNPNHDSSLFTELLGPAALGGFFCAGEIGPVGGTTYLHGYTSSFAIFRSPQ